MNEKTLRANISSLLDYYDVLDPNSKYTEEFMNDILELSLKLNNCQFQNINLLNDSQISQIQTTMRKIFTQQNFF